MPPKIRRSINLIKTVCSQCNLVVEEEDDSIECDKCGKTFHALCTALNKRQFQHLLKNESEEFVCHVCDGSSGCIKNEINEIKTKLKKIDQLDILEETVKFLSQQFDDMVKETANNKKKFEALQKENQNLKLEIKDLKCSIKFLNDSRVKNDCLINGVEVIDGSDPVETVLKIMKDVGVVLKPSEIDDAYFLKKKDNNETKKQSMVVKFTNKKSKKTVMSTKPKLKDNDKSIFINDYLSKETLTLLNYAKCLKEVGYRRVYPLYGKIYTKRSELSKPKLVENAEDVDRLLLESTQQRRSMNRSHFAKKDTNDSDDADDSYLSPI